jgi:hypothetical protein
VQVLKVYLPDPFAEMDPQTDQLIAVIEEFASAHEIT